ncbi:AAA-like domain-containing protein [Chloroflexi bacterium TSY]|nr:AAA-like domain-containing protein [Chloroflexi bacterium TSY]
MWAPRQRGKTWIMQNVLWRLREPEYEQFDVLKINLEHLKQTTSVDRVVYVISREIIKMLELDIKPVNKLDEFYDVFEQGVLRKPLILIMDEFDALTEKAISGIAGVFRNIYVHRRDDKIPLTDKKYYLLHGVALIGVRGVLGVENETGSPFNVQRSVHIPNLTVDEVTEMFRWYERESGQKVDQAVIDRVFYETKGQPGLVSWLGEQLTEAFNEHNSSIVMDDFEVAYAAAINALPNANVINLISKAKQEPYRNFILELFETDQKIDFRYEDPSINFLYMNGVIDYEIVDKINRYVKFPSPFVQKKLFNYFAHEIVKDVGSLHAPFEDISDSITEDSLHVRNLMRRHEQYLRDNREWLLKDAPRKVNLRVYEAVYHFNLFRYLVTFLGQRGHVYPEFPTGNSKIDLIIEYAGQTYGLEVKSYSDQIAYREALGQAALYGQQLGLSEIFLILFMEEIDETNRQKYEADYFDDKTGVRVLPTFVTTVG